MPKAKGLITSADSETVAKLALAFPTDPGFTSVSFPRLGMVSQDVLEETRVGSKKQVTVVTEAGTFFIERETDEEEDVIDEKTGNKTGTKKKWERVELGTSVDVIIAFQRKQLKHYDEGTGSYTSSTIYDDDNEVVKLFENRVQVDEGTPAELKLKYPGVTRMGKPKSTLEDNRIVYVLYEGELYQMTLRGTSMYMYQAYTRATKPAVNGYLTTLDSTAEEQGSTRWNKMSFVVARPITEEEAELVGSSIKDLQEAIAMRKGNVPAAGYGDTNYPEPRQLGSGE